MQNNEGRGTGYQFQPSASDDNLHGDLDYCGYHNH